MRLAILLSLALVPLGVIAFEQTRRLEAELERVRDLNFHAITAEIARREAAAAEQTLGAARALAATMPTLARDTESCRKTLRSVVERSERLFSFAGFLPQAGVMRCISAGEARDLSDHAEFERALQEPRVFATSSQRGEMSKAPVISVHYPVFGDGGQMLGYVSVSITARDIELPGDVTENDIALAVVDETGRPLGAIGPIEETSALMPADFDPRDLAQRGRGAFTAEDGEGRRRDYAVEPIIDGVAYAVGTRPTPAEAASGLTLWPAAYPVLMWLASVVLIFGVIESSLIGPVRTLGSRIRHFGRTRELPRWPMPRRLPSELALVEETFADMAERLQRDEQRLIDAVHEQEVLLKEVHHRVKNNLQIISSMINLQVRAANEPETERALERINRRIASLATVHRRLYQSSSVGQVEFDSLLRDVVSTLVATAGPEGSGARSLPEIDTTLAPLRMTPDQSLPATMFVVEAVTNALKYATPDRRGRRWIRVTLEEEAGDDDGTPGRVLLRVENSAGHDAPPGAPPGVRRTTPEGLGRRLIAGFARQLGGTQASGREGDTFVAWLAFRRRPFSAADLGRDEAPKPA
ncbi:sensor histidine kinase [Rhodovulum sp. 12E13]|nr:sensor histidine kinase [Rhodovulum sp. 12E13]